MRVALFLIVFLVGFSALAGPDGTICIAPVTKAMMTDVQAYPADETPRKLKFAFSVQLDSQPWIDVPGRTGVRVSKLAAGRKHLVRIRDAGETIESFTFTFEKRGGRDLCLSFSPFYATWSLEPSNRRGICRCK